MVSYVEENYRGKDVFKYLAEEFKIVLRENLLGIECARKTSNA